MKTTELEKRITKVEENVCQIKDNDLPHIQNDLTETKTNLSWLLKYHWITMTAAGGAVITGLIQLLK